MQKNIFFLSNVQLLLQLFPVPVVLFLSKNLIFSHLLLYYRKGFSSILTNLSNLTHSLSHQKFFLPSFDLKNVLLKHFPKMQQFANVLHNWCSCKFPDIHKKISVLESLFNKVIGLMTHKVIEKETPTQLFSCEYHKMFENVFF